MSSVYPAALSLGVLSCLLSAQSLVKTERSRQVLFGDVTTLNKTKNPLYPERLGTRLVCDHYKPTTTTKKCTLKAREKFLLQRTPASTLMVTWPSKRFPTNEWPPLMRETSSDVRRSSIWWELEWLCAAELCSCGERWYLEPAVHSGTSSHFSFEQYAFKALTDYKTSTNCSTKWCVLLKLFKTSCC